jgi:hypothetical protein
MFLIPIVLSAMYVAAFIYLYISAGEEIDEHIKPRRRG